MELREFIKQSLIEIINGVSDAQDFAAVMGAKINPGNMINKSGLYHTQDGSYGQEVEFDVAVVVNETTEGKINAGINVWGIGAGGQHISEQGNSTNTRIRFNVPLFLPTQKNKK